MNGVFVNNYKRKDPAGHANFSSLMDRPQLWIGFLEHALRFRNGFFDFLPVEIFVHDRRQIAESFCCLLVLLIISDDLRAPKLVGQAAVS